MNLYDQVQAEQERTNDVRRSLAAHGTMLGTAECGITFWVQDGKVWCDQSYTQLHYCGDYFDWKKAQRRSGHPILR